ncbi:hypothetical protein DRO91_07340 [Candidatus Heimdallarchaeota archaeon]|nr:MAG: hypothetical protein DRO91_07340 [Candidatus Heimdallarchaeota archaeon]
MKIIANLHNHTCYSRKDGLNSPRTLIREAVRLNQEAIAITDHGNIGGAIRFYKEAVKQGIKPILGIEGYHVDSAKEKSRGGHIVLLAKNKIGWKNLIKLNNVAHSEENFYYNMRMTWKDLEKYSEGLICLTACYKGLFQSEGLSYYETDGEVGNPFEIFLKLYKIFADDLYVEVMYHGDEKQAKIVEFQKQFCEEYGVKAVWTNDVHYAKQEGSESHTLLMCLQYKKPWHEREQVAYMPELYLKDEPLYLEGHEGFFNKAIQTQREIVDKCTLELSLGQASLPDMGKEEEIYKIAEAGFKRLYGELSEDTQKKYRNRFLREWEVIKAKKFYDYLWIVHWYTAEARKIMRVGIARGSSAGSLFCQCAGITDDKLDPIKYGLLFERFISPDRVSFPDVDNDFEDKNVVAKMIQDKFGDVAIVCSYAVYKVKSAFQDIGKLLGMTHEEVCAVTKKTIVAIDDDTGELVIEGDIWNHPEVFRMTRGVSEAMKNTSTHAAGVVLITKDIPLYRENQTQWDKDDIEEYGLVKFDVLGLANLKVIQKTLEDAGIKEPNWTYDDPEVFKVFSSGCCAGVFQFEEKGGAVAEEIGVENINDVAAINAINRPGPLRAGTVKAYIRNRDRMEFTKRNIPDGMECIEPILRDTYYTLLYQEQISAICRAIGFEPAQAEQMQKAIAKKKSTMGELRKLFYEKFSEMGASIHAINKLWKDIEGFAGYAFNKSHAMSYSFIGYQTAWLKTYYPLEFMINYMNHRGFNPTECRRLGIRVCSPHVSYSKVGFSKIVDDDGVEGIIAGITEIKGVGPSKGAKIIASQPYNDVDHFYAKTRIGGKLLEKLEASRCFREKLF